ncbi:hypothetical protein ENLAB_31470 [Enterococcus innesii]|uniref:Uncharacterized protein n=1 Tax=Enterococcus innesii TaxID=2839759 RepID=A0ABM7XWP1_9ENTE|nr:hypothetical protein ENLAB_31470 [Enterococcus innesii]
MRMVIQSNGNDVSVVITRKVRDNERKPKEAKMWKHSKKLENLFTKTRAL